MEEMTERDQADVEAAKERNAAVLDKLAGQLQNCREQGDRNGVGTFTFLINELSPGEPCHICGLRSVNGKAVCECGWEGEGK